MIVILGAGLAGLSCSYHLGHSKCLILEKKSHAYGHIKSHLLNGCTWDEGPHVSFTKHDYVKNLFAQSVDGAYEEYGVKVANYFQGHWIRHPAQVYLHQLPEPLRSKCLQDFINVRNNPPQSHLHNYQEWLDYAFGHTFARTFPAAYTRKYWTLDPVHLTPSWASPRMYYPKVEDVVNGATQEPAENPHYIQKVRYPSRGGYQSFAHHLWAGAQVQYNCEIREIDLQEKKITLQDETTLNYTTLISTIPLPSFLPLCRNIPGPVLEAARVLSCSELLLVNVVFPRSASAPYNWAYVYDEDKYATRLHWVEKLSPHNAPEDKSGIQVEVYASRHRPFVGSSRVDLQACKLEYSIVSPK